MFNNADIIKFLRALDGLLSSHQNLIIVGGTAMALGYQNADRGTKDLDSSEKLSRDILKHWTEAQRISGVDLSYDPGASHLEYLPIDYKIRLMQLSDKFIYLKIYFPEKYDMVLSKVGRSAGRDIADIQFIHQTDPLDETILVDRFLDYVQTYASNEALLKDSFLGIVDILFGTLSMEKVELKINR